MSGLAGVRWLDDERCASAAHLIQPLQTLAHRGPDGLCATASGPCSMGIARLVTTPEPREEQQPFLQSGRLLVTFDGRLDNAVELRTALGLRRHDAASDVSVVASAWERWGADSLGRLLGDFALAVWDTTTRELWLARDVFGLRPLVYRVYGGGLWWASEVQTLARLGDARVCEEMAAQYLIDAIRTETQTLVKDVYRLPRASVLRLDPRGAIRTWRYWTPAQTHSGEKVTDDEAVEQFQSLFSDAVRARMRSIGPVAVCLSGGVDSSLVAAEAARQASRDAVPPVEAWTLSLPGHENDESVHAQQVARHLQLPSTAWPARGVDLETIVEDAQRALDLPMPPNCVAASAFNDALRARGRRVCLSGIGGDEWFTGNRFVLADQLRQLRFGEMRARFRVLRREQPSYSWASDGKLALWAQLPEAVKQHLRPLFRQATVPAWVNETWSSRTQLRGGIHAAAEITALPSIEARVTFAWATHADKVFTFEQAERLSARYGCEEWLPFMDRRLVEWALTLPHGQRWRDGTSKFVLRNAARQILPAAIAERKFVPDCATDVAGALRLMGGKRLVTAAAAARRSWVHPACVAHLWDDMEDAERARDSRVGQRAWTLWLLVATHLAASAIETCADRWTHDHAGRDFAEGKMRTVA